MTDAVSALEREVACGRGPGRTRNRDPSRRTWREGGGIGGGSREFPSLFLRQTGGELISPAHTRTAGRPEPRIRALLVPLGLQRCRFLEQLLRLRFHVLDRLPLGGVLCRGVRVGEGFFLERLEQRVALDELCLQLLD